MTEAEWNTLIDTLRDIARLLDKVVVAQAQLAERVRALEDK